MNAFSQPQEDSYEEEENPELVGFYRRMAEKVLGKKEEILGCDGVRTEAIDSLLKEYGISFVVFFEFLIGYFEKRDLYPFSRGDLCSIVPASFISMGNNYDLRSFLAVITAKNSKKIREALILLSEKLLS
jgi:hypothetical protein